MFWFYTTAFLSEGYIFLFKLSLAIVEALEERILATNTAEVNKVCSDMCGKV